MWLKSCSVEGYENFVINREKSSLKNQKSTAGSRSFYKFRMQMQFAEFTGVFMRHKMDFRLRFEVICHFGHSTEDSLSLPKLINPFCFHSRKPNVLLYFRQSMYTY